MRSRKHVVWGCAVKTSGRLVGCLVVCRGCCDHDTVMTHPHLLLTLLVPSGLEHSSE